jgi:hypothetical protein
LGEGFDQSYPFFKVNIFRTGTGALHNKIITEALACVDSLFCSVLWLQLVCQNRTECSGVTKGNLNGRARQQ